ncbi:hypothetical protein [Blastopirellula marina]|uniref:Uncharacterized protein n=1 Tax=Blastopirellula marina TaxID=124 RepID=A0A2S8GT47_9BACT|nr:hypothetical protein [Blastopirellula marina]PQO47595.1 hypothetical protein C5Y93_02750 [Blastopirellula marina]
MVEDEPPQVRPPLELVFWAFLFQALMSAWAGLLFGMILRPYQSFDQSGVFLFILAFFPGCVVFVLYRSVFRRTRMAFSTNRVWVMPTLFVLLMLFLALHLPESAIVMVVVGVFFAMALRLVQLDLKWQRHLIDHDVPPRRGFSLLDLMLAFVAFSIALAVARQVMTAA